MKGEGAHPHVRGREFELQNHVIKEEKDFPVVLWLPYVVAAVDPSYKSNNCLKQKFIKWIIKI